MNIRPISVMVIAVLLIVTGAGGLVSHLSQVDWQHPFQSDILPAVLVCLAAIVCGAFLLRGENWARWLALAWMAFHVVLSVFHSWVQVAVHGAFLIALAYFLFRPVANAYFRPANRAA